MRSRWFGLVVTAVAAAVSIWAYPRLPETVATHWNLQGQPDGYSSRFWSVALIPVVILAVTGLFQVLPRLDPRHANYEKFLGVYWLIANGVLTFILVMHGLVLAAGLGYHVQIDRFAPVFVGLLLAFLGNYLTQVEPNWFVGIRTPWTLSSDRVWRKTHRTGGFLFVVGGLLIAASAFLLPRAAFLPVAIATFVVVGLVPVVQSYVLWKAEQSRSGDA